MNITPIRFNRNFAFGSNLTYVVGHKNPDTDSVCSAIAVAELANSVKTNPAKIYAPIIAGDVNYETAFALAHFNVRQPKVKDDISLTIREAMKRNSFARVFVGKDSSIREFIDLVIEKDIKTAVVLDDDKTIAGVVSRKSLADFLITPNDHLKKLKEYNVTYDTIKKLINAEVVTGNLSLDETIKGDVQTGAYSLESMQKLNLKDGIVIVGDREDVQLEAIKSGAKALIIPRSSQIYSNVIELAKKNNVVIFMTDLGVIKIATTLQQAIPISSIMDKNVVSFESNQKIDEARKVVKSNKFNFFPVLEQGKYIGMISREEVLNPDNHGVILVDHNNPSQFVDGIQKDNIEGILDHHLQQLTLDSSRVPMAYKPVGATATLVAREYFANNVQMSPGIAGILWSAIISDTDKFTSVTTTEEDKRIARMLTKIAEIEEPEVLANNLLAKRDADLEKLSEVELLKSDLKIFDKGGLKYAIGQIKPYQGEKYIKKADELKIKLNEYEKENSLDGAVLMITDLSQNATYLLVSDKIKEKAKIVLNSSDDKFLNKQIYKCPINYKIAFDVIGNSSMNLRLPNVQSRKEQVQPFITELLQVQG